MNADIRKQHAAATLNDPRWARVLARDAQADGAFFYSVTTTGVYCRPSCAARPARPENVRFHADTQAAEQAGFRACKRCRPDRLATTASEQIRFSVGACALGRLLIARSARGICAMLPGDDENALIGELQRRFADSELIRDDAALASPLAQAAAFIERPQSSLGLTLDARGTAFQQRVWRALRDIPAGATASYADIANRIGAPSAARAVAAACAANPLAVAIPCHRVIKRDGNVSGFRWGVERKRALLAREAKT